jgi:hypothetical protein
MRDGLSAAAETHAQLRIGKVRVAAYSCRTLCRAWPPGTFTEVDTVRVDSHHACPRTAHRRQALRWRVVRSTLAKPHKRVRELLLVLLLLSRLLKVTALPVCRKGFAARCHGR